jgi:A/G-specific adenine glycosylase
MPARARGERLRPTELSLTNQRALIARLVQAWFRTAGRDLPWRRPGARTGYAALVSETMAQQTQMARVAAAFGRFMERFPTVESLATADEQEVLAAWSGLGYYHRARHLHAAARAIVAQHGGQVPSEVSRLRALPGVGRYTAGAIASIAFGRSEPIVDGNVARVLLRLSGRAEAPDDPVTVHWLWEEAKHLVEAAADGGAFNEGLMELGAVLCTPRAPRCVACPLAPHCKARLMDATNAIPAPKRHAARRTLHQQVVVLRRGPAILVEQRPARGLWAGMWQAPTIESDAPLDRATILKWLSPTVASINEVGAFIHLTTHREVRVRVFSAASASRRGRWIRASERSELPMGQAARRAIDLALTGTR